MALLLLADRTMVYFILLSSAEGFAVLLDESLQRHGWAAADRLDQGVGAGEQAGLVVERLRRGHVARHVGNEMTARHFPAARSRSTITATLPSMPRPAFSDCSPALIASTVLSMVWLTCGTTSPCVAHSIARAIPRWRKACASLSSVAGSEK